MLLKNWQKTLKFVQLLFANSFKNVLIYCTKAIVFFKLAVFYLCLSYFLQRWQYGWNKTFFLWNSFQYSVVAQLSIGMKCPPPIFYKKRCWNRIENCGCAESAELLLSSSTFPVRIPIHSDIGGGRGVGTEQKKMISMVPCMCHQLTDFPTIFRAGGLSSHDRQFSWIKFHWLSCAWIFPCWLASSHRHSLVNKQLLFHIAFWAIAVYIQVQYM